MDDPGALRWDRCALGAADGVCARARSRLHAWRAAGELHLRHERPKVLAELAKTRLRKKLPALRKALDARFREHHGFLVAQVLAHVDYIEEAIAAVSERIDAAIASFEPAVNLLVAIPGV